MFGQIAHEPGWPLPRRIYFQDDPAFAGGVHPMEAVRTVGPGWEPLLARVYDAVRQAGGGPVVEIGYCPEGSLAVRVGAHAPGWQPGCRGPAVGSEPYGAMLPAFLEVVRVASLRICEMCGAPADAGPGSPHLVAFTSTLPLGGTVPHDTVRDGGSADTGVRVRCSGCADVPSVADAGPEAAGMDARFGWRGRAADQDARAACVADATFDLLGGDQDAARAFLAAARPDLDGLRPQELARVSGHHARRALRMLAAFALAHTRVAPPGAPTAGQGTAPGAPGAAFTGTVGTDATRRLIAPTW